MWLTALPLLLAGCATGGGSEGGSETTAGENGDGEQADGALETVEVGVLRSVSVAGIFIADHFGYFEEEGIEVAYTDFPNSPEQVAPLGTGQIDVGAAAVTAALINANIQEVGVKAVADRGSTPSGHGYEAILVRQDLAEEEGIDEIADLEGLTISTVGGPGGVTEAGLREALAGVGLSIDDVDSVAMGPPDTASAMANGSIDAAVIFEPFVTQIVNQGSARVLATEDEFYPDHQLGTILYSEQFIQERQDVADGFMRAYIRGLRDYNRAFGDDSDEQLREDVIDILVEETSVSERPLYDDMTMPGLDPDAALAVETMENDLEAWKDAGLIDDPSVTLDQYLDLSFRERAVEELGPHDG